MGFFQAGFSIPAGENPLSNKILLLSEFSPAGIENPAGIPGREKKTMN